MFTKGNNKNLRHTLIMLLMFVVFIGLIVLNVCFGGVKVDISETLEIIFSESSADSTNYGIIYKIRLPRMFAGVFLGGALALSGFLLQTFFNNPIAGPYVLGISSGAKLTVCIVMICFLGAYKAVSSSTLIIAAFIGAMVSMGFVLVISQKVDSASMLVVSGVMVGYICSAITDFIITFADDSSIVNLHNWSKGSFSGVSWEDVSVMGIVVVFVTLLTFLLSKPISAYQLGEAYAQNMGVNIKLFRATLVILSSILSACVTAFAGPISFVGIAVPHLVKSMLGTAKPIWVIPACFLGGAIFCLGCDFIARTMFAPTELSISSVTALFGAPVVIGIMLKKRRRAE